MPGGQDGFARLHGDDWAYGWNAGAIVEPVAGTRLGVAYRSEIDHTLRGDVDFTRRRRRHRQLIRGGTGAFTDTDAELSLTTPASLSFGLHQDLTERVAVMAEAQWTDWSVFDQLTVKFDNPAQPDSVTEEEWQDTWFFALGATFRATDQLTLRAGVAYDQSPVKDEFRTPAHPRRGPLLAVARRRLAARSPGSASTPRSPTSTSRTRGPPRRRRTPDSAVARQSRRRLRQLHHPAGA